MNRFLDPLRLARQDFFKLRKHRPAPAWALWVMTLLVASAWGLGMLALTVVLGRRWPDAEWWTRVAPMFLVTTLFVGIAFHLVFTAIERHAPDRFLAWANGEPGVLVSLFYALTSMACVMLGLGTAYLVLGTLPGLERGVWRPGQEWLSMAMLAVVVSVGWGLWAWQEWHEAQLKRRAMEAELKLLQAQIEPHFLFNTLANVRSLIDCDPKEAGELLDAFTDHLRASLSLMRADLVPLEQELELVGHYLKLMQLRMCERLRFSIDADAAARAVALPPLLLQPLVENAIHHGLECQVEPGEVRIQARVQNGLLRLSVTDDGVGLDTPKTRIGNGVATQNIRERLSQRYGPRARFELQPALPKGTRALIELPLTP